MPITLLRICRSYPDQNKLIGDLAYELSIRSKVANQQMIQVVKEAKIGMSLIEIGLCIASVGSMAETGVAGIMGLVRGTVSLDELGTAAFLTVTGTDTKALTTLLGTSKSIASISSWTMRTMIGMGVVDDVNAMIEESANGVPAMTVINNHKGSLGFYLWILACKTKFMQRLPLIRTIGTVYFITDLYKGLKAINERKRELALEVASGRIDPAIADIESMELLKNTITTITFLAHMGVDLAKGIGETGKVIADKIQPNMSPQPVVVIQTTDGRTIAVKTDNKIVLNDWSKHFSDNKNSENNKIDVADDYHIAVTDEAFMNKLLANNKDPLIKMVIEAIKSSKDKRMDRGSLLEKIKNNPEIDEKTRKNITKRKLGD